MKTPQNWVVTYGNAEIEAGVVTHKPQRAVPLLQPALTAESGTVQSVPPHTVVMSDMEFEQGTISWEMYLEDANDSCQVLLPIDSTTVPTSATSSDSSAASAAAATAASGLGNYLTAGLNCLGAPYGLAMLRGWKWEPISGSGQGSSVPVRRWIHAAARVSGSNVDFSIDGVRILSTSRQLRRGQVALFFQGNSEVKLRNLSIEGQEPISFVVMQFTDEFNTLYKDVIKPVCENFGYRVVRGDDFNTSGPILEDITRSIRDSALIIADITPDNPNVFYELGYAHAIGKPTILLSDRKRERLPFDVSGFRTLFYDNTIGGKAVVEDRLKHYLEALRAR